MSRDRDAQELLLSAIENAAARVLDGTMPVPWSGHQLVALVRFWGYGGHDLAMPEAFARFDLTMADLECFPNGRMTTDEQIAAAAHEVLLAARGTRGLEATRRADSREPWPRSRDARSQSRLRAAVSRRRSGRSGS